MYNHIKGVVRGLWTLSKYTLTNEENVDFYASLMRFRKTSKEKGKNSKHGMKSGHSHNFYEIGNSMLSEPREINYYIYGRIYKFNSNCFVSAPPGVKHLADISDKKQRFIINFSEEYGREVFGFLGVDVSEFLKNPVYFYSDEQIKKMLAIGEELVKECKDALKPNIDIKKNYRLKMLFLNFVSILIQPVDVGVPIAEEENIVGEIANYIKRNYQKHITVDSLSDKFYVNKYVMCKKFKSETDATIMEFLIRVRLNHARELLEETMMSITEIADAVGYNSAKYFASEFKKKIGISPVNYRKNVRKDL